MKTSVLFSALRLAFALAATGSAFGQAGWPVVQPKLLTIVRESVKPGRGEDHARHEAGWPAAFEKAKSTDYYIALTSMTGAPEAWYVIPSESHAARAASMKRWDSDPALGAELSRLSARDAEFIDGLRVIEAVGRPDLGLGQFPETAKMRFYEVNLFTVRPGQTVGFETVMKKYAVARQRVAPKSSYRVYMVVAGMPGPTYIIFSSTDDFGNFDQLMADHQNALSSATPDEVAEFEKWGQYVLREETQRFRLDPAQSYVASEVRDQDPGFWRKN
jgi:hypothetical protein